MDGISEMAKLLKERENKLYPGPQVGKVIAPPPAIKVALGDVIILEAADLVVAAHLLSNYERDITIPQTGATGTTASVTVGDHGGHSHNITAVGITSGKVKFTDTLKVGDEVVLIPSGDNQTYYLIDKAVRL